MQFFERMICINSLRILYMDETVLIIFSPNSS